MKKHIIIFIGHILLFILHRYLIISKGYDEFQTISFLIIHYIWHNLVANRIYGLKW